MRAQEPTQRTHLHLSPQHRRVPCIWRAAIETLRLFDRSTNERGHVLPRAILHLEGWHLRQSKLAIEINDHVVGCAPARQTI